MMHWVEDAGGNPSPAPDAPSSHLHHPPYSHLQEHAYTDFSEKWKGLFSPFLAHYIALIFIKTNTKIHSPKGGFLRRPKYLKGKTFTVFFSVSIYLRELENLFASETHVSLFLSNFLSQFTGHITMQWKWLVWVEVWLPNDQWVDVMPQPFTLSFHKPTG